MSKNMYPQIIGITGRKSNGKDTLGSYLVENHGYKRIAFADALKDASKCIFSLNDEQLYGNSKEKIDEFWQVTPRQILQFVGTDLFRNHLAELIPWVSNDIWVQVVKKKIQDELKNDPHTKFVITDVRFQNEIDLVKSFNGLTVRVERKSANTTIDLHQSELEIETLCVDLVITNDDTIENLCVNFTNMLYSNDNSSCV